MSECMHWVFFEMNVVMALRELIFNLKKSFRRETDDFQPLLMKTTVLQIALHAIYGN